MAEKRFSRDSTLKAFGELVNRFENMLSASDDKPDPIWEVGADPGEADFDAGADVFRKAIEAARGYLPLAYQEAFVEPLLHNMRHVVRSSDDLREMNKNAQCLAVAVVGHAAARRGKDPGPILYPLRQFLAVVSNLYRSFLGADKRHACGAPLPDPGLPPLVSFHRSKDAGPAVLTAPVNRRLCGSDVAVVILPAIYRRVPLAWASLAHEACGHGVLQADPGLVPDLVAGVRSLFGGGPLAPGRIPDKDQTLGLLWSYWLEETASDVYGLLNIGPAFALNLAAFMAAKRKADSSAINLSFPTLPAGAGNNPSKAFDQHPPDLLRLHVAIGVIQNLTGLSPDRSGEYVRLISWIAEACRPLADRVETAGKPASSRRAQTIALRGRVEVDHDRWVSIDLPAVPLDLACESARRVGAFIATIRLGALGNSSVQEIESWDDGDEHTALAIRDILLDPKRAAIFAGDDAKNPALDGFKKNGDGTFSDPKLDDAIRALDDDEAIEAIDRLFPEDAAKVVSALRAQRHRDGRR